MSNLNRVVLVGRLTGAPELKYTQSGKPVANFNLANNRTYTQNGEKKETASFFSCVAWDKLGEVMTEYCHKGDRIGIEGRLQQRAWEDQNGNRRSTVEIVVENFEFLNEKRKKE